MSPPLLSPPVPAAHEPPPVRRGLSALLSRCLPWLPLVLAAGLYVAASTGPALFDQNEALYAGAVREMMDRPGDYLPDVHGTMERGHWFVPTNEGIPRLQKPPLVYWALWASMRVFGVNEFGARLPNALASLAWFAGIFLLGRTVGGVALGRAAATILATMAGTFIFCHLISPEPFLAATLTWTLWCFLRACADPARAGRWMFGAWVGMTLGVGCKGLHGALYPLAVAGWLAWRHPGTRPVWRQLVRPWGPLFLLAALVPWYVAVARRYPGFLYDQFINEQWGHVVNRRYPHDNNPVPLWVFVLEHLILFLPWTLYAPAAWRAWRSGGAPERGGGQPALARELCVAWFVVTAVSVVCSSLQDYYLLTAWGPVAIWLARPWAAEGAELALPRWTRTGPGVVLAALGGLALGTAGALQWAAAGGAAASGGLFGGAAVARDTTLSTLAGFTLGTWRLLIPLFWLTGAAFLAGGVGTAWLAWRGRWRATLPVTALAMLAVLALAADGLNVLEDQFSLKRLVLEARRLAGAEGLIANVDEPVNDPSQLFYMDRPMYWVDNAADGEFALRELGIGRHLFLSTGDFRGEWQSARRVLLIMEEEFCERWRQELALTPEQARPVMKRGTRVLLWNGR